MLDSRGLLKVLLVYGVLWKTKTTEKKVELILLELNAFDKTQHKDAVIIFAMNHRSWLKGTKGRSIMLHCYSMYVLKMWNTSCDLILTWKRSTHHTYRCSLCHAIPASIWRTTMKRLWWWWWWILSGSPKISIIFIL